MTATICDICNCVCDKGSDVSLEVYGAGDKHPSVQYDLCQKCKNKIIHYISELEGKK